MWVIIMVFRAKPINLGKKGASNLSMDLVFRVYNYLNPSIVTTIPSGCLLWVRALIWCGGVLGLLAKGSSLGFRVTTQTRKL